MKLFRVVNGEKLIEEGIVPLEETEARVTLIAYETRPEIEITVIAENEEKALEMHNGMMFSLIHSVEEIIQEKARAMLKSMIKDLGGEL